MLFGEFFHNIDAKGRMNMPAKMRDELGESFCITLWSDDCLAVFSMTEWERICDRIRSLPLAQASKLQHFIFPNACMVEPDKQGRILLP
ncbi:MAG: division/cell wall cluster transcriptional repressor MraZ, partial [Oscillospiraceae bacterium]|nr:division/cell wall cluster transcriptional repressor MraZ [Oscillospiraceae bacterium]